ncbi:CotO family spore coat protein [Peribacillus kribbensis]|uniref:CotO family spore coat protein n=1 Tax=Peribacillus kribbensis TaxID=356658 RepID=UPI00041B25A7|nr:CotO family spore coat protein [Peribacillus kribbensis]
MSEKKDIREQKPFMYIVQPKLTPPKTAVQSEIRIKKTHHDEIIEIEELPGSPRAASEQVMQKEKEAIKGEIVQSVQDLVPAEGIPSEEKAANGEDDDIPEINIISITKEEGLETEAGGEVPEEAEEIQFKIIHSNEGFQTEEEGTGEPKTQRRKKIQKKFTEMTTNELLEYLIRIPRIVPKPFCEMKVNDRIIRGQIEKSKDDIIYIRPAYGTNLISARKEEIEYITFLRF